MNPSAPPAFLTSIAREAINQPVGFARAMFQLIGVTALVAASAPERCAR